MRTVCSAVTPGKLGLLLYSVYALLHADVRQQDRAARRKLNQKSALLLVSCPFTFGALFGLSVVSKPCMLLRALWTLGRRSQSLRACSLGVINSSARLCVQPPSAPFPWAASFAMATEAYPGLPEQWNEDLKDENGQPLSKRWAGQ